MDFDAPANNNNNNNNNANLAQIQPLVGRDAMLNGQHQPPAPQLPIAEGNGEPAAENRPGQANQNQAMVDHANNLPQGEDVQDADAAQRANLPEEPDPPEIMAPHRPINQNTKYQYQNSNDHNTK